MFSAARDKIARIAALEIEKVFLEVIQSPQLTAQMIDLNQSQLQKGVEADGVFIGYYARSNPDPAKTTNDNITLRDTGEFYDSMIVVVKDDGVVISGETEKEDKDLANYYPDALGLTEDSISELRPEVRERMLDKIKMKLKDVV